MAKQSVDEDPTVRDRLIGGARDILRDSGVVDLTVRKVAIAAGRSTMCVYTKFGNRRGMVEAIYDELLADLLAELSPVFGDDSPDAAQATVVDHWALPLREWAMRHAESYRLLFDHPLAEFNVPDSVRTKALDQVIAAPTEHLGADLAHRAWATCHGLIALERMYANRKPGWSRSSSWRAYYRSTLLELLAR